VCCAHHRVLVLPRTCRDAAVAVASRLLCTVSHRRLCCAEFPGFAPPPLPAHLVEAGQPLRATVRSASTKSVTFGAPASGAHEPLLRSAPASRTPSRCWVELGHSGSSTAGRVRARAWRAPLWPLPVPGVLALPVPRLCQSDLRGGARPPTPTCRGPLRMCLCGLPAGGAPAPRCVSDRPRGDTAGRRHLRPADAVQQRERAVRHRPARHALCARRDGLVRARADDGCAAPPLPHPARSAPWLTGLCRRWLRASGLHALMLFPILAAAVAVHSVHVLMRSAPLFWQPAMVLWHTGVGECAPC